MSTPIRLVLLALGTVAASTGVAQAAPFTGNAVGSWQNLQNAGVGAVYTITNHDLGGLAVFDFGVGVPGSFSNLFTFDGVGSNGGPGFSTAAETPFRIGHFVYRNGTTTNFSDPNKFSSIDLGILLTLTSPISNVSNFTYNFSIDITPNVTGDPVKDGDIATITNTLTTTNFVVGSTQYTLALAGFSTDGGTTYTSQFLAPEGATQQADIYATITTKLLDVPEPASIVLLGLGLAGLVSLRGRVRLG